MSEPCPLGAASPRKRQEPLSRGEMGGVLRAEGQHSGHVVRAESRGQHWEMRSQGPWRIVTVGGVI